MALTKKQLLDLQAQVEHIQHRLRTASLTMIGDSELAKLAVQATTALEGIHRDVNHRLCVLSEPPLPHGMIRHAPQEYLYLRAWNQKLGAYNAYIQQQQETASAQGAPLDTIYWSVSEGRWVLVTECTAEVQHEVDEAVALLRKGAQEEK